MCCGVVCVGSFVFIVGSGIGFVVVSSHFVRLMLFSFCLRDSILVWCVLLCCVVCCVVALWVCVVVCCCVARCCWCVRVDVVGAFDVAVEFDCDVDCELS